MLFLSFDREFTNHAKHGVTKEEEWNKDLEEYSKKYPEEAREFKQLVSGGLPQDWEKAIPVSTPRSSQHNLNFYYFGAYAKIVGDGSTFRRIRRSTQQEATPKPA